MGSARPQVSHLFITSTKYLAETAGRKLISQEASHSLRGFSHINWRRQPEAGGKADIVEKKEQQNKADQLLAARKKETQTR